MNENKSNRLINEKSPYLLQHAHNPVDWYPWGEEAFEKAKKENKPIFLSIGYSTCHWCHVMEHESFEDKEVADLMNDVFISIKVDREERPDIDHIYMTACQIFTGSGGWPLSIVMTHEKKPFFAGTYFPKENRYGRIGFKDLIKNIQSAWKDKRNEIEESAQQITSYIQGSSKRSSSTELSNKIFKQAFEYFKNNFDYEYGGFGSAPKFPSPHNLMFLLKYWKLYKEPKAIEMVEKTLSAMKMGGIYDHIGYGFHRYSTDRKWLVPHFEKMLYDQALLIIAYTETYQATGNIEFKETAEEVIEYILRDMTSPGGGFYSAEDADSEGEEGKFYVWTKDEIFDVLDNQSAELFTKVYNIKDDGNYHDESTCIKTDRNILHLLGRIDEHSDKLKQCRTTLFKYRNRRIHPLKDDKILTDWNGLMIAALARAGRALGNENYITAAEKSYAFIKTKMFDENMNLMHRYREGNSSIKANLDDYTFLTWGLIELYQTTYNDEYIAMAIDLTKSSLNYFWDKNDGAFYFSNNPDDLISNTKEFYDGAIPSGNSVMLHNLIMLSRIASEPKFEEYASRIIGSAPEAVASAPYGFSFLLSSFLFVTGSSFEIIIVGQKDSEDTSNILQILNNLYLPNIVIIFKDQAQNTIFEYLHKYETINDQTTIYVCKNHTCSLPTTNITEALKMIEPS